MEPKPPLETLECEALVDPPLEPDEWNQECPDTPRPPLRPHHAHQGGAGVGPGIWGTEVEEVETGPVLDHGAEGGRWHAASTTEPVISKTTLPDFFTGGMKVDARASTHGSRDDMADAEHNRRAQDADGDIFVLADFFLQVERGCEVKQFESGDRQNDSHQAEQDACNQRMQQSAGVRRNRQGG
jgi:hypothetical protein